MTRKASAMGTLTGTSADSTTDYIPIVDTSVADASKNKIITLDELKAALGIRHRPPTLSLFSYTANYTLSTQSSTYNASIGLSMTKTDGGGAGERLCFLGKAVYGSSPWTATSKVRFGAQVSGSENIFGGLALYDSVSGKAIFFGGYDESGATKIIANYYSASATFGSVIASTRVLDAMGVPSWWQIVESSTDYTLNYSLDEGITWVTHTTAVKATYFTADKVGVALGTRGTASTYNPNLLVGHYEDPDFP